MLIGFSGAQGAGKTTLLKALNPPFQVDDFKVSRTIQAEFSEKYKTTDLQSVIAKDFNLMVEFQNRVFDAKIKRDMPLAALVTTAMMTERTFADLYAYSAQWAKSFYEAGSISQTELVSFQTDMLDKCLDAQNAVYDHVFLLPRMEHIPDENDALRGDKASANAVYNSIVRFSNLPDNEVPSSIITQKTVKERVQFVIHQLWSLYYV